MAEMFRMKREKAEKEAEESKANNTGPSKSEVADRKARLLA